MDNQNEIKTQVPKAEEPIIIAQIKQKKERGPLGIIIFFSFLVIFAIFLPNITDFVKKIFNNEKNLYSIINDVIDKQHNKNDTQEIIYYDLDYNTAFTLNDLTFSNFVKNNDQLSFNVKNNKKTSYSFKNDNYYVELYDNTNMLLERIRINNVSIIETSDFENIFLSLTNSNASKLTIIMIKDENYPNINLAENEDKITKLLCKNNDLIIEYNFKEGKLTKFAEFVNLSNNHNKYNDLLDKYRNLKNRYFTVTGIDIDFKETENNFDFSMTVDYTNINAIDLDELKYYNKNTEAKVIKFELETSGYICS